LARVRARHPDLEAVVVGEGYERAALEARRHALGADGWIHLPGRVEDDALLDLYRRAWVVASTSLREGWGMTITEAAACGTPVLALVAYVPLLLTAPGKVGADTKQYLYLDPARLLTQAPSMWDPNVGMGTVTHQNIGYLLPMGPWYRFFDLVGVPDWIAQRLWT